MNDLFTEFEMMVCVCVCVCVCVRIYVYTMLPRIYAYITQLSRIPDFAFYL